jgi:hypothetical protein
VRGDNTKAVVLQDLLDDFDTYDQYVDVVSAFEWLLTDTSELPGTVRHFERYPRVPGPNGATLTPDFTVLFADGTCLIGEIAKLALHPNSVEKACSQIGKYATITEVPCSQSGLSAKVTNPDVLLLVPADVGLAAVQRIIKERFLDPGHGYKPSKPPAIAQYSRTVDRDDFKYTFQHIPDPANGVLPATPEPSVGQLLSQGLNVPARYFKDTKAARKFMNDPIKPLYLATHLWTATFPTQFGPAGNHDVEVDPQGIVATLRAQFRTGRTSEVRAALNLLWQAGLAADNRDGTWTVSRRALRLRGERDVHRIIARRATSNAKPVVTPRDTRTGSSVPQQATLW